MQKEDSSKNRLLASEKNWHGLYHVAQDLLDPCKNSFMWLAMFEEYLFAFIANHSC